MPEPRTVTVYIDYKSPYAYLAKDLACEIERDFPVRLDWLPYVLDIPSFLGSATLDVFEVEPLPPDSGLWRHPRVTITPHCANVTRSAVSAPVVAENIRRLRAGQALLNRVDVAAGY